MRAHAGLNIVVGVSFRKIDTLRRIRKSLFWSKATPYIIKRHTILVTLLYYFCDPPTKSSDEELGFFERESHYKLVHCVQCT